jgi:hypothetical protein
MSEKPGENKPNDPFESWRVLRDNSMDAWAKTMVEYVNSDAYTKTNGAILDTYLTASGPFRELLEKTMIRALEQLNMPTRADFVNLAQRLTNIEIRLDDLDAKLDRMDAGRAKPQSSKEK